jgi:hypothetical protein
MFIATNPIVNSGSSGAECDCGEYIALRWSAVGGAGGNYKHLVPPGPDKHVPATYYYPTTESRIIRKSRMLISDQVATAPCTDPIQERFRTFEAKPGKAVNCINCYQSTLSSPESATRPYQFDQCRRISV